ncbi:MAG: hypothetical protein C4576_26655 [Desulfobacteraceae bacterium]|nr:MAG: hypothetical protein C4576_26655 [Desulfobacteraceae bacterium]
MRIEKEEVEKYLDRIRGYTQDLVVYDSHVHPQEVFFGDGGTPPIGANGQAVPQTGAVVEVNEEKCGENEGCRFRHAAQLLNLKRCYRNFSPEHFLNHMNLAGVNASLLLPVAPASGEMKTGMESLSRLYGEKERFILGCSVPNTVETDKVDEFLSRMRSEHGARAVKLHPNITEIDPSQSRGRERVEAILDGCRRIGLPLVVHGGRSNVLRNLDARAYGSISNLASIPWSRSNNPVVIAHAGAYDCTLSEVEEKILPVLGRLLSQHSNLLLDFSGLECVVQTAILSKLGPGRIIFGSDALYSAPWRETVKLVYSLEKSGCDPEEGYRMIGGKNSEQYLFKKGIIQHASESVRTCVSGS